MARTLADVETRSREILQDAEAVRYTRAQIFGHLNDAVLEARSIRPDLFVGQYHVPINDVTDPAAPFPLPDQFFKSVVFYIVGCCELRDDEFAVDGRAAQLLSTFGKKLVAGA